jgi:phosphoribosylamine--glycine ligase
MHAGTTRDVSGLLVTSGGRVLGVVGSGVSIKESRESAYAGVELISFEGVQYRRDIAARAIEN